MKCLIQFIRLMAVPTVLLLFISSALYGQIVSPVPEGAQVEHLAGDILFGEGPLWHPDGFLLCSDIDGNQIFKIDPLTGAKEVYLRPSGGANGLAFDTKQNLIMCRLVEKDLARLEPNGDVTVLVSHYDGKRFNSPNDLVVRSDGSIFFTDPHFGSSPPPIELNFDGIYCLKPGDELVLLETSVSGPNGICLSPDEKKLYVNDARNRIIYVFDIENDSLTNKSVFAQITGFNFFIDGMKVDENGLLFSAAGTGGIWIFSPDGEFVDKITVPGNVTNLNWGDTDYQTLFITNLNNVYKIRLNTKGLVSEVEHKDLPLPNYFKLLPNYPNPFNPTTTINYYLQSAVDVELKIYNQLGQVIRILEKSWRSTGTHQVLWDGKDEKGDSVASGLYFYRLKAGSFIQTRKMILMK
jgi:gluconolactonase